jgi:hypothetical protein
MEHQLLPPSVSFETGQVTKNLDDTEWSISVTLMVDLIVRSCCSRVVACPVYLTSTKPDHGVVIRSSLLLLIISPFV